MADLSLVPTDALLEELHSRYDASLFCGEQQRGGGVASRHFRYRGSLATSLGLCEMFGHWARQAEFERSDEPCEGAED